MIDLPTIYRTDFDEKEEEVAIKSKTYGLLPLMFSNSISIIKASLFICDEFNETFYEKNFSYQIRTWDNFNKNPPCSIRKSLFFNFKFNIILGECNFEKKSYLSGCKLQKNTKSYFTVRKSCNKKKYGIGRKINFLFYIFFHLNI